ncbi:hypothetical protein SAMN03159341_1529 [Paenibacillus sp. 1_12]|nr:hypothetical protein SAMN03159341_1529 [Paenibacillus sp. 1_12]
MKYIQNHKILEEKLREFDMEEMFIHTTKSSFTLQLYEPDEVILHEGIELQLMLD